MRSLWLRCHVSYLLVAPPSLLIFRGLGKGMPALDWPDVFSEGFSTYRAGFRIIPKDRYEYKLRQPGYRLTSDCEGYTICENRVHVD